MNTIILCINEHEYSGTHDFINALKEYKVEFAYYISNGYPHIDDIGEVFFIRKKDGAFFHISATNCSWNDFIANINTNDRKSRKIFDEANISCSFGIRPKEIKINTFCNITIINIII